MGAAGHIGCGSLRSPPESSTMPLRSSEAGQKVVLTRIGRRGHRTGFFRFFGAVLPASDQIDSLISGLP